jgi:hypothetical protein
VSGSVNYGFPRFVSPVSGLGVIRTLWNFDWNVSLRTIGGPVHHPHRVRAGFSISITENFCDLTLNVCAPQAFAGFNDFVTRLNLTQNAGGPGNLSVPLSTTLTQGQTYQFSIAVEINVLGIAGQSSASYASFSIQAPQSMRLTMVTVR